MQAVLNSRRLLWALLALPGAAMLASLQLGRTDTEALLHPTGEFSARLMIVAMLIAPLISVIGTRGRLRWLLARRRAFGVAAFGYALLHLILYVVDMGALEAMWAEVAAPGIWTGWVAFALMVPLAVTSNDTAMRRLRGSWKTVQRLVYPAALLTLLHWVLVHNNLTAALAHFVPLALILILRFVRSRPVMQGNPT